MRRWPSAILRCARWCLLLHGCGTRARRRRLALARAHRDLGFFLSLPDGCTLPTRPCLQHSSHCCRGSDIPGNATDLALRCARRGGAGPRLRRARAHSPSGRQLAGILSHALRGAQAPAPAGAAHLGRHRRPGALVLKPDRGGGGACGAGPMGQCHPVPDDPDLKAVLAKHTRNHLRIWNAYNFARRILPGTDMGKARARWPRARGRPGCSHGMSFHALPWGATPAVH